MATGTLKETLKIEPDTLNRIVNFNTEGGI